MVTLPVVITVYRCTLASIKQYMFIVCMKDTEFFTQHFILHFLLEKKGKEEESDDARKPHDSS
jgi:hypothetical protein